MLHGHLSSAFPGQPCGEPRPLLDGTMTDTRRSRYSRGGRSREFLARATLRLILRAYWGTTYAVARFQRRDASQPGPEE